MQEYSLILLEVAQILEQSNKRKKNERISFLVDELRNISAILENPQTPEQKSVNLALRVVNYIRSLFN